MEVAILPAPWTLTRCTGGLGGGVSGTAGVGAGAGTSQRVRSWLTLIC